MGHSVGNAGTKCSDRDNTALPPVKRNLVELLCVAVPKVAGGICNLGLNVVLLRYFGAEQFGLYAVCLTAALLADAILGSAVDLGVIRLATEALTQCPTRALSIQKAGLAVKVASGVIVSGVLLLGTGLIERRVLHHPGARQLIVLSCLAAVGLMLLRTAQTNLQIERRFLGYGALELAQLTLRYGGIGLLLVYGAVQPNAVLFFYGAGPIAAFLVWAIVAGKKFYGAPANGKLFAELGGTVKWFALTFGLGALVSRLDIFLVSSWSSIGEAGIYGVAQTFALVPQLLGAYLAVVFSPRLIPYIQGGQFARFFRQFQTVIFAVCGLVMAVSIPTLSVLGKWILPHRFLTAQTVILVLLPGALAGLATFPVTITFLMFVRPRFLFAMDCLSLPILVLLYAYAVPHYGALGAAWVTTGSCLTRASIGQIAAWRWLRNGLEGSSSILGPRIALQGNG
jgi:O-antigen/teichoic acid export membrane protein